MKRFLIYFILSCQVSASQTLIDRFGPVVSPGEEAVDAASLTDALDYLKSQSFEDGLDEVLILRKGRIIYEGDSIHRRHNIYSCTKGFTSTILGILVDRGILNYDDHVMKVLPELSSDYPEATWRHFATMTSGYSALGRSRWEDENADWSYTPYTPEIPHFPPGTQYEYWDEAQMMYGRALTEVLKEPLYDFLDREVMQPIGITEWRWGTEQMTASGIPINNGCTGIVLNAHQMARFGLLMLQQGKWEGRQVLPIDFVEQATSVQVPTSLPVFKGDRANVKGSGSYGFNWWVNSRNGRSRMPDAPLGAYYLSGLNHNILMVVPEWDMVIVRMGDDKNPELPKHVVWNEFLKRLGLALK